MRLKDNILSIIILTFLLFNTIFMFSNKVYSGNDYSFTEDWSNSPIGDLSFSSDCGSNCGFFPGLSCDWVWSLWTPYWNTASVNGSVLTSQRVHLSINKSNSYGVQNYITTNKMQLIPIKKSTVISFDVDGGITSTTSDQVAITLAIGFGDYTRNNNLAYIIANKGVNFGGFSITLSPGIWERNLWNDLVAAYTAIGLDFENKVNTYYNGFVYVNYITFKIGNTGSQYYSTGAGWCEIGKISITNYPPVASFTYSPENPKVGDEITFNASSSSDNETISKYQWDFGDANGAEGKIVTHTYAGGATTWGPKLTVTDNDGFTNSIQKLITIADSNVTPVPTPVTNQSPVASFTYSPANPEVDEQITFDASSSSDSDGTISNYAWNFGDGNTGNGSIISHTFAKAEKYSVSLTVTDNNGSTGATSKVISVANSVGNKKSGQTKQENATVGEPVNIINGNMYIIKTDLSTSAPGIPFEFTRAYNSKNSVDGPFGTGTTHNFNVKITPPQDDTSSALIIDEDGGEITFYQTSPNVFGTMTGEYSRLTKGSSSFVWEKKDKITYSFNLEGKLQSIKDRNSNTASLSYDSQGRLSTITDTASRNYNLTYDTNNHITSIADSMGRTASYQYDSNGNLTRVTNPDGVATEYQYNDSNDPYNITKQTEDNKFIYTYSYDTQDRCTAASGQNGEFGYSFDYKPNEGKTVITDARGNVTTKYYNSNYMITQISYPGSSTESFVWNGNLNKTSETLQDGSIWRYEYDGNGNVTKITDPLGNYKTMAYDSNDNLTSLTDEPGRTSTYTYDSNGNLTKITYPDGTYTTFTYNSRGQPLTITDPIGKTTTYTYDSSGNLASATDPEGNAGAYVYNSLGQRTSETDPRGKVTSYEFDALNRVTKVTDALGGQINNTHKIAGLGSLKDQSNNTTSFQYDSLNQLTTITDPLGKTKQLGYDTMKNLTSRTDFNGSATTYTYNTMDRLTAIAYPDNSQSTFAYDTVGRLTRETNYTGTSTLLMIPWGG
ncbi:MAG TPA: PKD domain-containing protein [Candidatus Wunengus sp. YC60]|uniref:PKD domain-containing protein n=1 Tax=Candidatus Wunengus sp. YC60 TaxID=3367697 RepID=UPI004026B281